MGTRQSVVGVGFSVIILLLGATIVPAIVTPVILSRMARRMQTQVCHQL